MVIWWKLGGRVETRWGKMENWWQRVTGSWWKLGGRVETRWSTMEKLVA